MLADVVRGQGRRSPDAVLTATAADFAVLIETDDPEERSTAEERLIVEGDHAAARRLLESFAP